MMSGAFGSYGGMFVAVLAVFVTFGTVNAYVAGMARVYYAAARDGVFRRHSPRWIARPAPREIRSCS